MSINPQDVLLSGQVSGSGSADLSDESPMEFLYKWSNAGKSLKDSELKGAQELYKSELYYYNVASTILSDAGSEKLRIAFGGFSVKGIKALAVKLKELHEKRILEEQMNAAVTAAATKVSDYKNIITGAATNVFTR